MLHQGKQRDARKQPEQCSEENRSIGHRRHLTQFNRSFKADRNRSKIYPNHCALFLADRSISLKLPSKNLIAGSVGNLEFLSRKSTVFPLLVIMGMAKPQNLAEYRFSASSMSTQPTAPTPQTLTPQSVNSFAVPPPQLWAMIVGISHYPNLQPLQYGERDARVLHEWLTQQAGISIDRALLLTDCSAPFYQHSTYPDRSTLSYWVQTLRSHGIQNGDTVWFFFSGYGDCWNGEDYLLPIDADPASPPHAWIKTKSLLRALKSLPTDRIVVFLDINRSQSVRHGQPLGKQTVHYAQELGITTVLSCQPDEFSQESPDLGHGLFTAALLDTLRSHPSHQGLNSFLHRLATHLSQLCQQSDRPCQTPLITLANTAAMIIPTPMLLDCLTTGDMRRYARPPVITMIPSAPKTATRETLNVETLGTSSVVQNQIEKIQANKNWINKNWIVNNNSKNNFDTTPRKTPIAPISIEFKLVLLTGLLALASLGAITFLGMRVLRPQSYTHQLTPVKPSPSPFPPSPSPTITPLQVPEQPAGDSAAILEEARNYITPTNPDEVLRAIDRASQIPPGDPGYTAAQRQIDRWSAQLLKLAQAQANQGNWRTAIAIASQIRGDRSVLHTQAKTLIHQWKQRSQ